MAESLMVKTNPDQPLDQPEIEPQKPPAEEFIPAVSRANPLATKGEVVAEGEEGVIPTASDQNSNRSVIFEQTARGSVVSALMAAGVGWVLGGLLGGPLGAAIGSVVSGLGDLAMSPKPGEKIIYPSLQAPKVQPQTKNIGSSDQTFIPTAATDPTDPLEL